MRMNHTQRGVTLVELMIAMVISTIILLGVVTVYSSSKRSYNITEEFSRLQENARFAFGIMGRDIRGAGYAGCNPKINNLLDSSNAAYTDALFDFQSGIDGWEYTATPTAPGNDYTIGSSYPAPSGTLTDWTGVAATTLTANLNNNVIPGTDILVVKSADLREDLVPTGNTPANAAQIDFTTATNIPAGTIVVFSDCDRADVFQKTSNASSVNVQRQAAGSPGNLNPGSVNFSHEYSTDARISVVKSRAYFIGTGANGGPALFRADFSSGTGAPIIEEIVEGVENMQVLYGEDLTTTDTDIQPTRYVTANNITDTDNVISVRVSLLLRTVRPLAADNKATGWNRNFRMLGVASNTGVDITAPDDERVRRVFTSTFFLRNKGLFRQRL